MDTYQAYWDRLSETHEKAIAAADGSTSEAVARSTGAWTANQVRHALHLEPEDTVLEMGCGVGRIGRELSPHCARWLGVDISANMLATARQRLADLPNIDLHHIESGNLSFFADASLDKVYTVAVLIHMDKEDLYTYCKEFARILKCGGLAFLETWNLAHPIGWRRWEAEVNQWQDKKCKDVGRNQFCHPEEFKLYVCEAGLDVLAVWDDSPWIQLVAGKALTSDQRRTEKRRLAEASPAIAYTPLFGRLFDLTLDVLYGEISFEQAFMVLDAFGEQSEVALYRHYIKGLQVARS